MLLKEFLASKGNNKYFTTKPQIANLTYKNCQPRHWLFFESICCIQMKTRARVERGNVEGLSFKNQFRPKFTIAKRRNSSSNLFNKNFNASQLWSPTKSHIQQKGYICCHILKLYNTKVYHLLAILLLLTPLDMRAGEATPASPSGDK